MEKDIFKDLHGTEHKYYNQFPIQWRISGYLVICSNDSILCVRQKYSDKYELPGGGINANESITEGILREFLEEVGFTASIAGTQPFYLHQSRFYNQDQEPFFFNSLALFFKGNIQSELPINNDELPERAWIKIDSVDELVQSMHADAIKNSLK